MRQKEEQVGVGPGTVWLCLDCGRRSDGPGQCTASEHSPYESQLYFFTPLVPAKAYEEAVRALAQISLLCADKTAYDPILTLVEIEQIADAARLLLPSHKEKEGENE